MADHAIVIGIDAYAESGWQLNAAVRDAVAFARWVTEPGAGRASVETLTLLLSRKAGAPPLDLEYQSATKDAIHQAFDRYVRKDAGKDAARLWVFYAGHGVNPPGGGLDAAPVLVGEDEDADAIDGYQYYPPRLNLANYLGPLQAKPPKTQLYFIDACRGIVESDDALTVTTARHVDLSKLGEATPRVGQALLLATTAGRRANEVGLHGVFSKALIRGLKGQGPELKGDPRTRDHVLTFSELSRFVGRHVSAVGEGLRKEGRELPTQVSTPSLFGCDGSMALVRYRQLPKAKLSLVVQPVQAAKRARAAIRTWRSLTGDFVLEELQGPPAPVPVNWRLPFRQHNVEVTADGFKRWSKAIDLVDDTTDIAELEPLAVDSRDAAADRGSVLRGRGGEEAYDRDTGLESLRGLVLCGDAESRGERPSGHLVVGSRDRHARIELYDEAGERVAAGAGRIELADLPVGPYRAVVTLPGRPPVHRAVVVTGGAEETVTVDAAGQLAPPLAAALTVAGIEVDGGMSHPSEAFGPSTTSLGSLLAWAAWAARFPAGAGGERLRRIGIDSLGDADPERSYMQVVAGDAGGELLRTLRVAFGPFSDERPRSPAPVPGLSDLAVQWSGEVPAGGGSALIRADGLNPTSLPVPPVTGHVSVLVVTREADGRIDVQRYLHALAPADGARFSDAVRRQEIGWRALASRQELLPGEAEELADDEHLDPLATAIVGYRLAREGRLEPSFPLRRALRRAPGLPDLRVLEGMMISAGDAPGDARFKRLAEPMEAARSAGLPVVADGYQFLDDWATELAARSDYPPPIPIRPPRSGGVWTALNAERRVAVHPAASPAAAWEASGQAWAARVRPAVAATARIETPGPSTSVTGTGFLVAPGILATSEHCIGPEFPGPADGVPLAPGWTASFGPRGEAQPYRLLSVRTRAQRGPAIGRPWGVLRVTLVRLEDRPAPAPVRFGWGPAEVGQRIAVIGHPAPDPRLPREAIAAAFASVPMGEKVVIPGIVVAVSETRFQYEAFTMNGVSGGPVVDVETGEVVGVHFGGSFAGGKKSGYGVPMALLRGETMWPEAGVQAAGG